MPQPAADKFALVMDLFHRVVDLAESERRALFATEAVPAEVATEVEALLETSGDFANDVLEAVVPQLVPEPEAASALVPGAVFGDYEIVREIARGGMGAVFEARQHSLGRTVALKVILGSRFATAAEVKRFHVEAESVARLSHPGIVPVYEVGELDGEHFFTMGFVAGGSLAKVSVPMAQREAARIVKQVAEAIHFAHAHNVVHRDLTPGNVLLSESGAPQVSDFGLAKDTREGSDELTRSGMILGTPGFLSPEQARGELTAIGPASDVYGLGAILYYLLTGRAPLVGDNQFDTMYRVVHEDPPPADRVVATVPRDLASICGRCLAKAPDARYSSAQSVADELRRFLAGEPVIARPVGTAARFVKWCRRRPALATAIFVAVIAVIGSVTASTWFGVLAGQRADIVEAQNKELGIATEMAESARGDMQAFSDFLVLDVLVVARDKGIRGGLGRDLTVREALVNAIANIEERFAGRPAAEALACQQLGVTLRVVGELELAVPLLRRALELRRRELGPDHDDTLDSQNSLAAILAERREFKEAEELLRGIVELDPDESLMKHDEVLFRIAINQSNQGQLEGATALLEQLYSRSTGSDRIEMGAQLGKFYRTAGELNRAMTLLDEVLELARSYTEDDSSGNILEAEMRAMLSKVVCLRNLHRETTALR